MWGNLGGINHGGIYPSAHALGAWEGQRESGMAIIKAPTKRPRKQASKHSKREASPAIDLLLADGILGIRPLLAPGRNGETIGERASERARQERAIPAKIDNSGVERRIMGRISPFRSSSSLVAGSRGRDLERERGKIFHRVAIQFGDARVPHLPPPPPLHGKLLYS